MALGTLLVGGSSFPQASIPPTLACVAGSLRTLSEVQGLTLLSRASESVLHRAKPSPNPKPKKWPLMFYCSLTIQAPISTPKNVSIAYNPESLPRRRELSQNVGTMQVFLCPSPVWGASLMAQRVKNRPEMQKTWVGSLVRKIPWRREYYPF